MVTSRSMVHGEDDDTSVAVPPSLEAVNTGRPTRGADRWQVFGLVGTPATPAS